MPILLYRPVKAMVKTAHFFVQCSVTSGNLSNQTLREEIKPIVLVVCVSGVREHSQLMAFFLSLIS